MLPIWPRQNTSLTQDEANAEKERPRTGNLKATAAHETAETPEVAPNAASTRQVQGATAEHLGAETEALKTPAFTVHDTEDGPLLVARDGTAQHLSIDGQPVGPKLKLTQHLLLRWGRMASHTPTCWTPWAIRRSISEFITKGRSRSITTPPIQSWTAKSSQFLAHRTRRLLTDAQTQLEKIADARTMINGNAEAQAYRRAQGADGSGFRAWQRCTHYAARTELHCKGSRVVWRS